MVFRSEGSRKSATIIHIWTIKARAHRLLMTEKNVSKLTIFILCFFINTVTVVVQYCASTSVMVLNRLVKENRHSFQNIFKDKITLK